MCWLYIIWIVTSNKFNNGVHRHANRLWVQHTKQVHNFLSIWLLASEDNTSNSILSDESDEVALDLSSQMFSLILFYFHQFGFTLAPSIMSSTYTATIKISPSESESTYKDQ